MATYIPPDTSGIMALKAWRDSEAQWADQILKERIWLTDKAEQYGDAASMERITGLKTEGVSTYDDAASSYDDVGPGKVSVQDISPSREAQQAPSQPAPPQARVNEFRELGADPAAVEEKAFQIGLARNKSKGLGPDAIKRNLAENTKVAQGWRAEAGGGASPAQKAHSDNMKKVLAADEATLNKMGKNTVKLRKELESFGMNKDNVDEKLGEFLSAKAEQKTVANEAISFAKKIDKTPGYRKKYKGRLEERTRDIVHNFELAMRNAESWEDQLLAAVRYSVDLKNEHHKFGRKTDIDPLNLIGRRPKEERGSYGSTKKDFYTLLDRDGRSYGSIQIPKHLLVGKKDFVDYIKKEYPEYLKGAGIDPNITAEDFYRKYTMRGGGSAGSDAGMTAERQGVDDKILDRTNEVRDALREEWTFRGGTKKRDVQKAQYLAKSYFYNKTDREKFEMMAQLMDSGIEDEDVKDIAKVIGAGDKWADFTIFFRGEYASRKSKKPVTDLR